ncbi:MAG: hypothetical protein V3R28_01500 [Desulfatiglandales bacterium]
MHTKQPMVSPFRILPPLIYLFIVGNLLTGCISYRFIKATKGRSVPSIFEGCRVGKTTLQETLETLGAPDQVVELEGKDVLIYQRSLLAESRLSFGIPLSDILIKSFDLSGSGSLVRYDLLLLFFTPDGILREIISEKGSQYPYLKTILSETLRPLDGQKITSIQGQFLTSKH